VGERDVAASQMTPEEIAEAQRVAGLKADPRPMIRKALLRR
jgi:hypothetical protein